jgi:hypothetical protein
MRYLSHELQAEETVKVEAHLVGCPECTRRMSELHAVQNEGKRSAPAFVLPPRSSTSLLPLRWLAPAAAVMASFLAAIWFWDREPPLRPKGPGIQLDTACRLGQARWSCRSGEALRPGTAIMFRLKADEPHYVMLWGKDGSGRWQRYFPQRDAAQRCDPGADPLLDRSLVLDVTPGPERFFLFYSKVAFATRDLRAVISDEGKRVDLSRLLPSIQAREVRFEKRMSQTDPPGRQGNN